MSISFEEALRRSRDEGTTYPWISDFEEPEQLPQSVVDNRSGFFDPDEPWSDLKSINLKRVVSGNKEQFLMDGRKGGLIAYKDRWCGVFLVPNPAKTFATDFASVPRLLTWLVPKSGSHLPAAILHDGLIPAEKRTFLGPAVERREADRIFRDAMRDLGTGWIQRWLAWTAVVVGTESIEGLATWRTRQGWWILPRLVFFVLIIVLLGIRATVYLFDSDHPVPWMTDSPSTPYKLLLGGLFAVIIPIALSLAFLPRKMFRAAMILGIAIALFLHTTALIALLLLLYYLAETSIAAATGHGKWDAPLRWLAALVAAVCALLILAKVALRIPDSWTNWSFRLPLARDVGDGIGNLGMWIWDQSGWLYLIPLIASIGLWLLFRTKKDRSSTSNQDTLGSPAVGNR